MNDKKTQMLYLALPILQGLLASGHYTTPDTVTEPVQVLRCDNGKDWKEGNVFVRRHTAMAVEHALSLASELFDQIKLDEAES